MNNTFQIVTNILDVSLSIIDILFTCKQSDIISHSNHKYLIDLIRLMH